MIRAILAHDSMWGIGKAGDLPWPKNSEDLAWFKESTQGSIVVMGKTTWDSLPKKPLPNRKNVVVTSNGKYLPTGVEQLSADIMKSRLVTANHSDNVWIIGGAKLLESCLDICDELWLNNVGGNYDCDTFLPKMKITKHFYAASTELKPFGLLTIWEKR